MTRKPHPGQEDEGRPPYNCPWCGAGAWIEPGEIDPPIDYCHPGDHGSPDDYYGSRGRAREGGQPHACPEWDGLFISPEDPEFEACSCEFAPGGLTGLNTCEFCKGSGESGPDQVCLVCDGSGAEEVCQLNHENKT